ncbi:MAG: hypothetical protein KGJ07_00945 [Patescibacteria group bacterium]|nr:hypothetical protein [Patescibacteria group bacterium]MDE2589823.1 hypothetical protein [Patescibacteria group bacterium]
MTAKKVNKNRKLVSAFKKYQKRSSSRAKKMTWKNFLPEILFRTMRLEGEHVTRKETKALFR